MSWQCTAVISVVVLQNGMDIVQGEPGSSDESCGTCTLGGNKVTSIEAERVSYITDKVDQELAIKTERNVSCVSVLSVTQISYRWYADLPSPISVSACEINMTLWNWFWRVFKERKLFVSHCIHSSICSGMFYSSIDQIFFSLL